MKNITLKTTNKMEDAAEFITQAILRQLNTGKKVLFFYSNQGEIIEFIEKR